MLVASRSDIRYQPLQPLLPLLLSRNSLCLSEGLYNGFPRLRCVGWERGLLPLLSEEADHQPGVHSDPLACPQQGLTVTKDESRELSPPLTVRGDSVRSGETKLVYRPVVRLQADLFTLSSL